MTGHNLTPEERQVYERLSVPFCVFGSGGDGLALLAVSDGFCEMFGAAREAFSLPCGELLRQHLHPDDLARFFPDLESAGLQPDGRYKAVYRVRAGENDSYRWLSGRGRVVTGPDGSRTLYVSFHDAQEETENLLALNAELEKRIAENRRLMDTSEVCIATIDLRDYTLADYNDAVCRMIGFSREEYEARRRHDMAEFFTGEYRDELDRLRDAVENALSSGQTRFTLHLRIPTAQGRVWVGGTASFGEADPQTGRPAKMYAVYRDITDIIEAQEKRKQAEEALQKSALLKKQAEKMRRLIDSVPSGLGELTIVGGVPQETFYLNRYFTESVDLSAAADGAVRYADFPDCIHPDDRERCRADFREFLASAALTVRQYRFRGVTGKYYWCSVRGALERVSADLSVAYFLFANIDDLKTAEARLRDSHRFYREVVRAAKLSTWDYDIRSRTITLSADEHTSEARRTLGMPRVIQNVPAALTDAISEEDQPAFLQMYREVDAGRDASCEAWYKPVNGREPRCERITYIAVASPDGKPARAIGFTQNITAERKMEERYQRELGFLRQADENNLLAKGHYNITQNTVLEYSTKNDDIFRVEPGIPFDKAFQAFAAHAYDESERREILDRLDRKKLAERYQRGQLQTGLVYRRSRSGQLPLWISMNIYTYTMPETGDLECFTYAYDITDERQSDEIMGLIATEEFDYIGLLFAETGQFELIKKSPEIRFPDVRQRVSYADCCDYVRRNFVNDDERARFDAAVSAENIVAGLRESGKHVATYRRTENGKLLCKQVDCAWIDRTSGIILMVRSDITSAFRRDQEQLAHIEAARLEADRANEAKSAFLSSMSHDLRTPLNGVLGFTRLALRETDGEKKQDYLRKIEASGNLLMDLVNDTLELSRIESGKAVLEPEAVMPDDLIPAVVTALRPSAELKGVRLETDYANDASTPVWCDKLKVQKIALNLLSNAIKYTPEGGRVRVLVRPVQQGEGCRWLLTVEDTGIGMSEEFMRRMYEPFAQEKRSEAVRAPGTGLGLSIVKRYVDLMGGTIEVDSRLHEGTRWSVSLPIRQADEAARQQKDAASARQSLAGERVLLCEDNVMNTEIATVLLKDQGVAVDAAENGSLGYRNSRRPLPAGTTRS